MSRSIPDTAARSPVSPATAPGDRPLVLVIDPDASARSVLEVGLSRDGFEVWSADSGPAGLLLLQGRVPAAVVLETELGGEEGFSFVAQLRGDERLARVPVLLLATSGDENVEALADVVGVDDFIQKPAFARDVAALVRLELARAAGPGPMRFEAAVLEPAALLRALLSCPRSGRLVLVGGRAELRFRSGRVIDARFDGKGSTLDTVVRALALTRGEYQLALEPVDGFAELQCALREFVQLAMPRLQRWAKVQQRSLPLEARLQVDFGRLAQSLKALPDQVNRVVQLFDGHRTVQDALVDSVFDETTTLEVATRLYLMGVLAPVKGEGNDLVILKPMPRLFEPRATEAEELMAQLFAGTAEIRAEVSSSEDEEDWYTLAEGVTGLEVPEPDGGWTTAPVPEALAAGLSPEVVRQLDAFQTPMRVEKPEPPPGTREARRFAEGAEERAQVGLETVVQGAADTALADDPELDAHRRAAKDRQARIETPWMTPVVALELVGAAEKASPVAPAQASLPVARDVPVSPTELAQAMPREVVRDRQARIETPWLTHVVPAPQPLGTAASAPSVIVEPVLARTVTPVLVPAMVEVGARSGAAPVTDAEASFFADAPAAVEVPTTEVPAPTRGRRWLYVAVAAGLLLLIAGFEALRATPAPVPAPVAAPVFLPDIDAPEFFEVEDEQVLELAPELIEAAPIDVTAPLAEARTHYEAGRYRQAIALLEQVVSDDAKSVNGWLLLGLARYDALDVAGARAAADQVLALEPTNARVQVLLATLHFDANDREAGKAALQRYLELEPRGAHAAEAKALLNR